MASYSEGRMSRRSFLQVTGGLAATSLLSPILSFAQDTGASHVNVGTIGDLTNLDPFVMTFNNYPMMENVYDQFVRLDNQMNPHPGVIEAWEPSEDGTRLTLKMRQGIQYHDGSMATIEDVVQCIWRASAVETGGNQFQNWQTVIEVTADDESTVEVVFSAPVAFIIAALGFISLIRPSAFDNLSGAEGGSGPFKVVEWLPGDHLDLERFDGYWDPDIPNVESAQIRFFADEAAMIAALEAGTIDIALNLPPRELDRLSSRFNVVRGQDAANFYYLGMNPMQPPFDQIEVRRAMAHALDKEAMTRNVLFGVSNPIGTPYPEFSFAHFPEFEDLYPFDLERSQQLLTEAGYPDGIEFTIATTFTFPEFTQFAEILQANLAQIGTTVHIEPMDIAQWVPVLLESRYGAIFSFAGGTQWYPTRITLSSNFAVQENSVWPDGMPPAGYLNGITQADTNFDPAVQREGMRMAVESLMTEMWAAPIAFRYTLFAQQLNVEGFGYGVYDQPRLREVSKGE